VNNYPLEKLHDLFWNKDGIYSTPHGDAIDPIWEKHEHDIYEVEEGCPVISYYNYSEWIRVQ